MCVNVSNSLTPTIPISFGDRHQAESFLRQQHHPEKAKQVYLNTLAILAVQFQLKCLGFAPNWKTCDSFDPLMQSLLDVADLELPNLGTLECRPVLPNDDIMTVPAEVFEDRLAYIAVRFNHDLTEAQIIGFIENAEEENVPLSKLRSPDELWEFLHSIPTQSPRTNLSHWLQNSISQGWQTVEQILTIYPLQSSFNFRSRTAELGMIKRGKVFNLEHQDNSFALLMGIQPINRETNIFVEIYPTGNHTHLPSDLKLNILNETGLSVMEAISKETKTIQMEFKGEIGEPFSVKISLGELCITEDFVI